MKKLIILSIFLFPSLSFAISFDAVTEQAYPKSANGTYSHTITGTNPFLIVVMYDIQSSDPAVGILKWNNVELTMAGRVENVDRKVSVWYLFNPDTGTHNLVQSGATAGNYGFQIGSYIDVNPSLTDTPVENSNNPSTSLTLSLTPSVTGAWLVGGFQMSGGTGSAGSNTTVRSDDAGVSTLADNNGLSSPTAIQITAPSSWNAGLVMAIDPYSEAEAPYTDNSATSTIEQSQTNLANGLFMFLGMFTFIIWFFRKRNK